MESNLYFPLVIIGRVASIISLLATTIAASGEDFLIPHSISPNGRFVIYAVDSDQPYFPASLEIRDLTNPKFKSKLDTGGYVRLASEYDYGEEDRNSIFVLWNGDASCLAMMVRAGKRNGSLVIYYQKNGSFEQRALPDFGFAVTKAFNLKMGNRYIYEFPKTWIRNDELAIIVRCDGIDPTDAKSYQFEFALKYDLTSGKIFDFKLREKHSNEG